jgi:hypothetical protein
LLSFLSRFLLLVNGTGCGAVQVVVHNYKALIVYIHFFVADLGYYYEEEDSGGASYGGAALGTILSVVVLTLLFW